MPRLDGTGPKGMGPMTGRGLGKCNPKPKQTILKKLNQKLGLGRKNRNQGK